MFGSPHLGEILVPVKVITNVRLVKVVLLSAIVFGFPVGVLFNASFHASGSLSVLTTLELHVTGV